MVTVNEGEVLMSKARTSWHERPTGRCLVVSFAAHSICSHREQNGGYAPGQGMVSLSFDGEAD